ncbi:MAG: N-acetylmuramic acid 6-phosphate etherase [Allobaculum sp.]
MSILDHLDTEKRNPNTVNIDRVSTKEMLELINQEDQKIPQAVHEQLDSISHLVDAAYECVKNDGRIVYVGAGTSGRLGILDASECPPTYGVSEEVIQAVIAGGTEAIFRAKEGAEDDPDQAKEDLKSRGFSSKDMVIGLAASGRTPYVIGAIKYANEIGAATGSVSCCENAEISQLAQYPIEVVAGPEVITGSTRMKAGTCQKLVLNMISTTVMIKSGKVYHNYMVDVQPTNHKLEVRAQNMIQEILGFDDATVKDLYIRSGKNVKLAILMGMTGVDAEKGQTALNECDGVLAKTIKTLQGE